MLTVPLDFTQFQHTAARRRLGCRRTGASLTVRFQHTAARRRLGYLCRSCLPKYGFNTQPPEGGWQTKQRNRPQQKKFQHTAARRRLDFMLGSTHGNIAVSTHSRPKAAGMEMMRDRASVLFQHTAARRRLEAPSGAHYLALPCFNTQPPEGGWPARRLSIGCR